MMFIGVGKVWDSKRNVNLCSFGVKGVLNTEDPYVIRRLHEMGYDEAKEDDMVNIEICNGIHVDWKNKYDLVVETNRGLKSEMVALKQEYAVMEKRIAAFAEVVEVRAEEKPDKVIADWRADFYDIGGNYVTRDYLNTSGVSALNKLKTFIKSQTGDADLRAMKKDEAITEVTKILKEKELI